MVSLLPLGPALQGGAIFAPHFWSFCPQSWLLSCLLRALGDRPEEAELLGLPALQLPSGLFIARP